MSSLDSLYATAIQQHQAGNLNEAERLYRLVLREQSAHADALHLLGVVLGQTNRHAEAIECLRQAVLLSPGNSVFQNNLGEAYQRSGDFTKAAACARAALRLEPSLFQAHFLLANAMKGLGDIAAAVDAYRHSLSLNPRYAKAHYNLANTLRDEGWLKQAIDHYQQSAALQPNHVDTLINLGQAHRENQQPDAAAECYRQALVLAPRRAEIHGALASLLWHQGLVPEAIAHYRKELEIEPSRIREFRLATLCPPVSQSNQQIDEYRERLGQTLDAAIERPLDIDVAHLHSSGIEPPFPLAYQGRDELPLKRKYARLFEKSFPGSNPAKQPPRNPGRPRIGFVVTRGHEGVFMKCQRGILENLSAGRFQTTVVCPAFTRNYLRTHIQNPAVEYLVIGDRIDEAVETIRAARFDLLLYWEVGTDSLNYFLPFFRLAPLQATTFGWPVTTGIPQMDFFVSSDLLELAEGDHHYSERLFRLKTLPTYYYRPAPVAAPSGRGRFGLDERSHLYFCGQRVRKFHPDFDQLLAGILHADPHGVFVFISDAQPGLTRLLTARLQRTLPDVFNRVRVVEWLGEADYLALTGLADVVLDTPHYGGGANTVCDAFAVAKPIVTLPGQFQRSRYCAAAYAKMGLTGCVAASPQEYVECAVRLGTDVEYRQQLTEQIAAANSVLFEDLSAVNEFERFFDEAIESLSRGGNQRV